MNLFEILLAMGVLCGFWNVAMSIAIYGSLQKRGVPVSFLWLRLMAPKYAFQYKEITRTETGKVGLKKSREPKPAKSVHCSINGYCLSIWPWFSS